MTPVTPSAQRTTSEQTPPAVEWELDPEVVPNLDDIVTEDQAPLDKIFTEKQQRLLTEPLYNSWAGPGEGRPFLALANVGLFHIYRQPPLVPDALLSLDVTLGEDLHLKENHSYFIWVLGKPPDVVIGIVSDLPGGEADYKLRQYARIGVLFYVIFDPENLLGHGVLRAYVLERGKYAPVEASWLPEVSLGLTLWEGKYEGSSSTWLRWCERYGRVIPSGAERSDEEHRRAEDERRRAEEEHRRAEDERRRAKQAEERIRQLEAQLRALGAEPEGQPPRRKRGRGRS
jgi:Putative restriction endonuclease